MILTFADLVSIANGAGGVGRLMFGVIGDYCGQSCPFFSARPTAVVHKLTMYMI